jgi:hypothetical protein
MTQLTKPVRRETAATTCYRVGVMRSAGSQRKGKEKS